MKNIKNNMHRSINKITIDFIKTAVGSRGVSAKLSEVSNNRLNSTLTQSDFELTLILSDDVFRKDSEVDFIYYLSLEDHAISRIDASRISDSKITK